MSRSRRSTQAPESRSFPRAQRLTRGTELELVRHQGKRVRTASMDVRATASLRPFARVGFVIPKYKHNSVLRNRLKRRLRELVRVELLPTLRPMDVVLRVSPAAYSRNFDSLKAEVVHAARMLSAIVLP